MDSSATIETAFNSGQPSTVLFSLIITSSILWYTYFRLSRRRLYELADKIDGPPGYPFFGNVNELIGSSHDVFEKVYSKSFTFGSVVKAWAGPRLIVFLTDPRDIELILSSHVHIDKSPEYQLFKPWLGDGLLISTGEKWRTHRKIIAPTFHLNVLKSFFSLFNANSKAVVKKLQNELGKEFDCHDYMSETTVEILLETAMGVNKETQKDGLKYAKAVMDMCDIIHHRQIKIWLRPNILFQLQYGNIQEKLLDTIHSLTKKVLKMRKEEYLKNQDNDKLNETSDSKILSSEAKTKEASKQKETKIDESGSFSFGQSAGLKDDLDVEGNDVGEKKRMAFLDHLIESSQKGAPITDEEIKEQVDTIMFEGHDTTAAGSSFFLCIMAAHPDIQDKIHEELDNIFGDSDRDCTFQDTVEMKYLERCIMETLRMYPPVPLIARQLRNEQKLVSQDITVPSNCTVLVGTFKLHRSEEIYENPNKFNPDNFLPEKSANRHYYSFIPFSAGPRSCVGRKYAMLKLKVLLSTILRNYKIKPGIPEEHWKLQADIILKRTDGFKISIEPRKRTKNGQSI